MGKKVYFSPSDQVCNSYAVGGTNEAFQCRKICRAAVEAAKRCGLEAKTNEADGSAAMDGRIQESNAWGADLHIPIHTNAFNGTVMGTRMFCYELGGEGHKACKAIMARLSPVTPGSSDNIVAKHFAEVRLAAAPTAYVEVGFHDNPTEAQWIIDHTEDIAEAIVHGVCDYFGVAYVPKNEEKGENSNEFAINLRQMGNGDSGEDIRALQVLLTGRGFDCGPCGADGIFGTDTAKAVRAFQKAKNLSVDGIAGPDTFSALLGVTA